MPAVYRPSQRANWAGDQPISMLMSRALANPELISLAAGFVDQQTLPARETEQALADLFQSLSAARAALQYGTTPGYPPLRELLLERTWNGHAEARERGWSDDRSGCPDGRQQSAVASGLGELGGPGRHHLVCRPDLSRVLGSRGECRSPVGRGGDGRPGPDSRSVGSHIGPTGGRRRVGSSAGDLSCELLRQPLRDHDARGPGAADRRDRQGVVSAGQDLRAGRRGVSRIALRRRGRPDAHWCWTRITTRWWG